MLYFVFVEMCMIKPKGNIYHAILLHFIKSKYLFDSMIEDLLKL